MTGPGSVLGPPDGAAPHVVVDDLGALVLDDDAHHHLARVRRLRAGEALTATDGAGAWVACRWTGDARLEPADERRHVPRPSPPIGVAFALTKGVKPDWTVQKLTELGVDRIVPFRAERSVVRWDEAKADHHHARLVAIARGAVEQSKRCWLPEIAPVADLAALVTAGAVRADRGAPGLADLPALVAIGPEGGWSDGERTQLPDAVSLAVDVLRAETAALTAGAVLGAIRSGIVGLPTQYVHGG